MTEPFTLPPEIQKRIDALKDAAMLFAVTPLLADRTRESRELKEARATLEAAILSGLRQMGETREPTPEQAKAAFIAIHGYAPRWIDTRDAEGPELRADDEERMAVICDVLRYRSAPVAEPPKPPTARYNAGLMRTADTFPPVPVPPVSALPTQQEGQHPLVGRLDALIWRLYSVEVLPFDGGAQPLASMMQVHPIMEDLTKLLIDLGAALSRPPREPSEAAFEAATQSFYGKKPGGLRLAIRAAYAADFGATPPPGGNK